MNETNSVFHIMREILLSSVPFILLCLLNAKMNLKKQVRSRQFLMPLIAVIYCIFALVFMNDICVRLADFMVRLTEKIAEFPYMGAALAKKMRQVDWYSSYIIAYVVNAVLLLAYYIVKKISTIFMNIKFSTPNNLHKTIAGHFYDYQEDLCVWTINDGYGQARQYFRYIYYVVLAISSLIFMSIQYLVGHRHLVGFPFYPVICILIIGECYFFLDGMTKAEYFSNILGEDEDAYRVTNYTVLRPILRKLFGDRELSESVGTNNRNIVHSNDAIVHPLLISENPAEQIFGVYLKNKAANGLKLNIHYVHSMVDLLKGNSVLFSNPFYHDISEYLFYVVHHILLKNKKILIVAGRHATEEDLQKWVKDSIGSVTGMSGLWEVGILSEMEQNLDIGIIPRSMLHNLSMMDENQRFLDHVGMVIIMEPSKLITTAQIGLSLLVKKIKANEKKEQIVFCSFDHNSDGLIDALSHILTTSISEVSATSEYEGTNTRMFWNADGEYLHHRIIPNVSRYLGVGTDIAAVAIRNQISKVHWYGGEAFPVVDMHWIVGQYFSAFANYTGIGRVQEEVKEHFKVRQNLWDAKVQENQFLIVEDELKNMFEMARQFSTRAKVQGFVNVISSNYLLRDYMADNAEIFAMDAKAIPTIVADYARTERNSILRLLMQMASKPIKENDIRTELEFLGISANADVKQSLQKIIEVYFPTRKDEKKSSYFSNDREESTANIIGESYSYELSADRKKTIVHKNYFIENPVFLERYVAQLQNAYYVSEDEKGNLHYLGAELMGQIAQKHLPGQYFTYNGKYYEVLSFHDHNVFVRRAADHISQREYYRQERRFSLGNLKGSELMGELKEIGTIRVNHYTADITVNTPAYYRMQDYCNLADSKRVTISNIPTRQYLNKSILQLDLTGVAPEVRNTLCLLLNELFYSVYPEGYEFLCAVTADGEKYGLTGQTYFIDGMEADDCIYILEDSQLDIGLLISVERYLRKFMGIIHDYLDWHLETLEKSQHPGQEERLFDPVKNIPDPEPRKGFFKRLWERIKSILKKKQKHKVESSAVETLVMQSETEGTTEKESLDEEIPKEASNIEDLTASETVVEDNSVSTSEKTAIDEKIRNISNRKPYYERYYLLYGSDQPDAVMKLEATKDYLGKLGFINGYMKQAREGKDIARQIKEKYNPELKGFRSCDFCGIELVGSEYEILADGRERCINCGKTAVTTEKEFVEIYKETLRNLEGFFGIRINVGIRVKMTTASKIAKRLGNQFYPTPGFDARVVGVAIKSREGYTLMLENGAPRISAIMTIAHELTHIWQYLNWNERAIKRQYGNLELQVYEGMAKWVEIQYAILLNENEIAIREEINTRRRQDEYGYGFLRYIEKYPFSRGQYITRETPFMNPNKPL